MYSAQTVILALLFVAVLILIGLSGVKLRKKSKECQKNAQLRLAEKKSTDFLDKNVVDDACDICFGEFENGRVAVCKCGMKFHEECAELTEECPYCKMSYKDMTLREIRRPHCPYCGKMVEKNVCPSCGTVYPNRDMRFECVCGSTVFAGDGYCKDCGAVYEFTYDGPRKVR